MRTILSILSLILCSCTGYQFATFNPDGSPKMVAQVDATLAEGEASAREMRFPNGTVFTSVQQKYDGTRVAGGYLDMKTTLGLADIMQPAAMKATKDPNKIPKDPNKIPKDPNVIPLNPNKIPE